MANFINEKTRETVDIASYRTPKQLEKHRQIQARKEQVRKGKVIEFVACFHDPIREVTQHLSLTESGAVMKLLLYMKVNGKNLLQRDGKSLIQADIEKILRKGRTQTVDIVKRLEYLSIITPVKVGRSKTFYLNKDFHYMGKLVNKPFTKLMKAKLSEIVDDLKLEQLGFLYKILPYFHYDNCYLAYNPNEHDLTKVKYMNRIELAAAINYGADNITILVKQLRKKGLIMTTKTSGKVLFRVHPDLMYRQRDNGNNEKFNVYRAEFEAHRIDANRQKMKQND